MAFTELIDRKDALNRLGVKLRILNHYVSNGMPHKGGGKAMRFPWPDILHWQVQFDKKEDPPASPMPRIGRPAGSSAPRTSPKMMTTDEEILSYERRKRKADAEMMEHKLLVARQEVVPIKVVKGLTGEVMGRIRSRLTVLPSEFAPRTINISSIPDSFNIWQEAMGLVIQEICDDILTLKDVELKPEESKTEAEDDDEEGGD